MEDLFRRIKLCTLGICSLVLLGLGLRTYHYVRNQPVWHDEAALILNVLQKDYCEFFGPLFFSEAAPPLFLILEKWLVDIAGDHTFVLRFLPWLTSCLSLIGIALLCRKFLPPWGAVCFLWLFACSDRLLFHGSEAKPYALDVLIATGFLLFSVWYLGAKQKNGHQSRLLLYLIGLAGLSPILLFLSFPACFLLGGASLCLLIPVYYSRSVRVWVLFFLYQVVLGSAFLLLYFGTIRNQRTDRLLQCWEGCFPYWKEPWSIPGQLCMKVTEVFRYTSEPVGGVLSILAVIGGITLWRQGHKQLVGFLTLPLALAVIAWLMGQYVIGPTRVMIFYAPSALLLVAAGFDPVLSWSLRYRWRFGITLICIGLVLFPGFQAVYRLVVPWKKIDVVRPVRFVLNHRQPDEPVIGCKWEHAYYFRTIGSAYRPIKTYSDDPPYPLPMSPVVPSSGKSQPERVWTVVIAENFYRNQFKQTLKNHRWEILKQVRYPKVEVYYLRRVPDAQLAWMGKQNP